MEHRYVGLSVGPSPGPGCFSGRARRPAAEPNDIWRKGKWPAVIRVAAGVLIRGQSPEAQHSGTDGPHPRRSPAKQITCVMGRTWKERRSGFRRNGFWSDGFWGGGQR
ncbi:hypothetical protein DPEC_G00302620 [Dallia pectoralis]|uniref:Uncharacterized protein n=1 Tax=Dallia pectoralis TaxID=75939 RepID=A0ACC2FGS7_DALPE|nr:hypothetical protein DPEC_G00302620 [Dallia pectoralis]